MILAALSLAAAPIPEGQAVVTDAGPALVALPDKPDMEPERAIAPAVPEGSKCVKTWGLLNAGAHAADVASTLVAFDNGYVEKNPIIRAAFGKRPSAGELIAFKAASIGLFQIGLSRLPTDKDRCLVLKVNTVVTFGLSSLNWRAAF
jgi:hypothetical protein